MQELHVDLTDVQKMILSTIRKKGRFVAPAMESSGQIEEALRDLMWNEFIERDKTNGMNINVFVRGWFFVFLKAEIFTD